MADLPTTTHTRLARRLNPVALHTLWQASDHLLAVESYLGCFDVYHRVYFRDLQAIIVRRTPWRTILAAASLLLALISGGTVTAVWQFSGLDWLALLYLVPLFFIAWPVILWWRGPTCSVALRTPIQTVEVGAVGDEKSCQKLRAAVLAVLAREPGADPATLLPTDDAFHARLAAHNLTFTSTATVPAMARRAFASPPVSAAPTPLRPCRTGWHRVFFALLMATAGYDVPAFVIAGKWYELGGILLLLATLVCLVMALVNQHRSDLIAPARRLPWIWLGYAAVSILASVGIMVYYAMTDYNWKDIADLPILEHPPLIALNSLDLLVCLVIGMLGLQALAAYRRQAPSAVPSAPPPPAAPPPGTVPPPPGS